MAAQKSTDYATLSVEETEAAPASYAAEGRWLVCSEVITVVAARAWEFSVPLALLGPPGPGASLRAPAALALATTLATASLAPPTGAWADRSDRRKASRVARLAQIGGTALGVGGVSALVYTGEPNYTALALVLVGGAVESVASVVSKNAPKKDWAPALFDGDALVDELSHTTSALATAGQVAEVIGPLLGALCVSSLGPRRGAGAAGILNIASSAPAQAVLDGLYAKCPKLRAPRVVREEVTEDGAWTRWAAQPSGTALVTLAFCCLWFTALAPHGAVLTAFLATQHADPELIAGFRICGAFFGFVGIVVFSKCSRVFGARDEAAAGSKSARRVSSLRMAALGALVFQLMCAALVVYALRNGDMILVFCGAVACSRAGLYAFDVGYVELQQLLVDERDRGACQGVEAALCGAMELGVALTTLVFFSDPASFVALAELSTLFVALALVCFGAWLGLYRIFDHVHAGRSEDHAHTAQDLKRLANDGRHVHVAYAGVKACTRASPRASHAHHAVPSA